jgi:hypothetical protein
MYKAGAVERGEFLRAAWRVLVARMMDRKQLVFVDEMGTKTSLCTVAYSPKGRQAYAKVPRNRESNTTLLSSMTLEGMEPSLAVEGSTTPVRSLRLTPSGS